MNKEVLVLAVGNSAVVKETVRELVACGEQNLRRPRTFQVNGGTTWHGSINHLVKDEETDEERVAATIGVKVVQAATMPVGLDPDWVLYGGDGCSRHFTSESRNLHVFGNPPVGGHINTQGMRFLALSDTKCTATVARNGANHLAAQLTTRAVFNAAVLQFPGGTEDNHYCTVAKWVENHTPLRLASATCLNADESRTGIVTTLSPEIVGTLVRAAQAAFRGFPKITEWVITTFGPKDFDWLGELGISKVLLPYMWDAPREKVLADMERNFALIERLAAILNQHLPFPVRAEQLSDNLGRVEVAWLVESSYARARVMLPELMKPGNTPAIFAQLNGEEDVFARVQQEAFLYLLDTIRHGQCPGEERPAVLSVGLEVHGGYYQHGNLSEGPNGEFLPIVWLPKAVRQHWGNWVLANGQLKKERERLTRVLNALLIPPISIEPSALTIASELVTVG